MNWKPPKKIQRLVQQMAEIEAQLRGKLAPHDVDKKNWEKLSRVHKRWVEDRFFELIGLPYDKAHDRIPKVCLAYCEGQPNSNKLFASVESNLRGFILKYHPGAKKKA